MKKEKDFKELVSEHIDKYPNLVLEQILSKDNGLKLLRTAIAVHTKKLRKNDKKGNNYEKIAIEVYDLIVNDGYQRSKAIEFIVDKYNYSQNSGIEHHLGKFNKFAKTLTGIQKAPQGYVRFGNLFHFINEHSQYKYPIGQNTGGVAYNKGKINEIVNHLVKKLKIGYEPYKEDDEIPFVEPYKEDEEIPF